MTSLCLEFRPKCKGIEQRDFHLPGEAQPGFATGFPLHCEGWLSGLGSHLPARRERDPGTRPLGRAAELRWVFLFPRDLVMTPDSFLTWANAAVVGVLGATNGWLTQA